MIKIVNTVAILCFNVAGIFSIFQGNVIEGLLFILLGKVIGLQVDVDAILEKQSESSRK